MTPFSSRAVLLKLHALICLFFSCAVTAQNIQKGELLDSILVQNHQGESYALYMPNSLIDAQPAPIIFVFDPAARGTVGINPFIDVSEEYGYIIVCSNNSKNGPYENNFKVAENLFDAIFSNFNVDTDRMYLAGFSGGSRLATAIACLSNKFSAVIGCGAGFSGAPEHTPTFQDFTYVGVCGNEDTNYREMLNNKSFFKQFNFKNTLITFDGNHQWPSRKEINRAFRWLVINENKESMGSELILKQFHADYTETKAFLKSEKVLLAAENYDRMLQSYSAALKIDSLRNQYNDLIKSKSYKKAKKSLSSALIMEADLTGKLVTRLKSDFKNPEKAKLSWWEKEIEKLDDIKNKKGEQFKKMVARIKFNIFAIIYERNSLSHGQLTESEIALGKNIRQIIYPR